MNAHTLTARNPLDINRMVYVCSCGWEYPVPREGAYRNVSNRARIAQAKMVYGRHLKAVNKAQP